MSLRYTPPEKEAVGNRSLSLPLVGEGVERNVCSVEKRWMFFLCCRCQSFLSFKERAMERK